MLSVGRALFWLLRAAAPVLLLALLLQPVTGYRPPLYVPLVFAAAIGLWAVTELAVQINTRITQRRNAARGLCRFCGYNLAGITLEDNWHCAECGRLRH